MLGSGEIIPILSLPTPNLFAPFLRARIEGILENGKHDAANDIFVVLIAFTLLANFHHFSQGSVYSSALSCFGFGRVELRLISLPPSLPLLRLLFHYRLRWCFFSSGLGFQK